jgi:hypothetical protein
MVAIAQARNEIRSGNLYPKSGEVIFYVYQIELRKWLAGTRRPNVEIGLDELQEALQVVIAGLKGHNN